MNASSQFDKNDSPLDDFHLYQIKHLEV